MVDEVHRLRLQLSEANREEAKTDGAMTGTALAGEAARTRIAELEAPGEWFRQQQQSWAEERSVLLAGLEEYKVWNAELQKAKEWFEQQSQSWEQESRSLLRGLEATKALNLELLKEKQALEIERGKLL